MEELSNWFTPAPQKSLESQLRGSSTLRERKGTKQKIVNFFVLKYLA